MPCTSINIVSINYHHPGRQPSGDGDRNTPFSSPAGYNPPATPTGPAIPSQQFRQSRVDDLLRRLPPKEAQLIYVDRVRALEADLPNEPILTVVRCGFPFGTMVVTDRRLLVLLQDSGGVQAIAFSEIASLHIIDEGRAWMGLGAQKPPTLVVNYHNGRERDAMHIGHDGDWGLQAAHTIVNQHQRHTIRHT
jgi:hypothetical protein